MLGVGLGSKPCSGTMAKHKEDCLSLGVPHLTRMRFFSVLSGISVGCIFLAAGWARAASPVWAEAEGALNFFDLPRLVESVEPRANASDPDALFLLGIIYEFGLGKPIDDGRAAELITRAANAGVPEAAYYLRERLMNEFDGPEVLATILRYDRLLKGKFRRGALAWLDLEPDGAVQNWIASREANTDLALTDDPAACYNLAVIYLEGLGVEPSEGTGLVWLRKAAEARQPNALYVMGRFLQNQQETDVAALAGKANTEQPQEDKALEYFLQAADAGHLEAIRMVTMALQRGRGMEADPARAFRQLLKAAETEDAEALGLLGQAYQMGLGVEANLVEAFNNYRKAAEKGNLVAGRQLAILYSRGIVAEPNLPEAFRWMRWAALRGDALAQMLLGDFYFGGVSVSEDKSEALFWYERSAERGYPAASLKLAALYTLGKGVDKDPAMARFWQDRVASHQPFPIETTPPAAPEGIKPKGSVVLELTVDTEGNVSDILVISAEVEPASVKEACESAVRQWRFLPGKRNGEIVSMRVRQPFNFTGE